MAHWRLCTFCFLSSFFLFLMFIYLFIYLCLFRAAPTAYGSSQTRGWMRAGLHHSHNEGSGPHLWPMPQLQQCRILNLLSSPKDWTHILMDTSRVRYRWAHNANSYFLVFLVNMSTAVIFSPSHPMWARHSSHQNVESISSTPLLWDVLMTCFDQQHG